MVQGWQHRLARIVGSGIGAGPVNVVDCAVEEEGLWGEGCVIDVFVSEGEDAAGK